jgi:hypothetical protein
MPEMATGDQGVRRVPRNAFQPLLPRMERNIEKSVVFRVVYNVPDERGRVKRNQESALRRALSSYSQTAPYSLWKRKVETSLS